MYIGVGGIEEVVKIEDGGVFDTIGTVIRRAGDIAKAAGPAIEASLQILEDPYLPETACEIIRLSHLEAGDPPGPPCERTDPALAARKAGVGLKYAVTPLRLYVSARQNPWMAVLVGGAVVGGILYVGYRLGKSR